MALSFLNRLGGSAGAHPLGCDARGPLGAAAGPDGGLNGGGLLQMGLGGGDLLTGSAVAVNRETHGGILSFWSRGARSSFAGREGALSLGDDVRTTVVGADYAKGPLVAGLSLSHSRGLGEYVGVTGGQVASSVTGLYPWLGYQVTDRVSVWGVTGYGAGGLWLTPDGGLALRSGLVMADAATGLAVDVRVRTLLVHQAEGFRERGLAVSLSYNPTPSTPLGLTARVVPSWGGQATSGAEALWGRETVAGLAHGGGADDTRLDAELGYGLPVGSRFVGTPRIGVGTSEMGRDYRLGYGLGVLGRAGTTFELGVDAQRRERPLQGGTDHAALARATMAW